MLHTEVDPLVKQTPEALVGGNLAANLLHRFLTDLLGAALHLAGIADTSGLVASMFQNDEETAAGTESCHIS